MGDSDDHNRTPSDATQGHRERGILAFVACCIPMIIVFTLIALRAS